MASENQTTLMITLLCAVSVLAQAPNPYGPPVSVENAKKAAASALAEAQKGHLENGGGGG